MMTLPAKIWSLSWPLILANISVPLLGLIDTAILGHLGSPVYLAAVSVGASLVALILNSTNFLRMSATGLAANALKDSTINNSLTLFKSSVFFALIIALVTLLLSPVLAQIGSTLILGHDDSDGIRHLAIEYSQIRLLSAPAVLINYILIGWAIAWQKPRLAVIALSTVSVLNILFDLVFILLLDLNSFGAALASLIADYLGMVITAVCFYQYFPELFRQGWYSLPSIRSLYALLRINNDLFIRSLSLLFCFAFLNSQSAKLGVFVMAANAILLQIIHFQSYALDGFANATEALVGASKGGKERHRILTTSLTLSFFAACMICLILMLTKPFLVDLFTNQMAIRQVVNEVLWLIILLPLVSVFCYWLDGVAVGLRASSAMRNSTLVSAFLVFLPCTYLLQDLGNTGLWLAFILFTLARSLSLAPLVFYRQSDKR